MNHPRKRSRRTAKPAAAPRATYRSLAEATWLVPGVNLLAYCRSSTEEQSQSCTQQCSELLKLWTAEGKLTAQQPYEVQHDPSRGVYWDEGVSGWKHAVPDREHSSMLLAYCQANPQPQDKPGVITVWSLSRLGRFSDGPMQAISLLYDFYTLGWCVWSQQDGNLSPDDKDRLLNVLKIALNSEKDTKASEEKSAGVARGKADLVKRGWWQGSFPPFGYDRCAARVDTDGTLHVLAPLTAGLRNGYADAEVHTVLVPNADAHHVKQIFAWVAHGEVGQTISLQEITARMNATGARPYSPRGKCWYPSTVGKILSNSSYLGVQFDQDGDEHTARWEPLVDAKTWSAAHSRLRENAARRSGVNATYILTGLLECAQCKARYGGERRPGAHGVLVYYRTDRIPGIAACPACANRVRAADVEPAVLDSIHALAHRPEVQNALAEEDARRAGHAPKAHNRKRDLEQEIEREQRKLANLLDAHEVGGEAAIQSRAKITAVNSHIEQLKKALVREARGATATDAPTLRDSLSHIGVILTGATHDEKKRLLGSLVRRVLVDTARGELVIHYRHIEPMIGARLP